MQVYEGLNHIADITELTKKDVEELQTSVKILALQKKENTTSFVGEYANHIIGCIQRETEAIDNNDLVFFVAFPMMDGCVLKIAFTGVNMDEAKYDQLWRALVLKVAGIAGRYYNWLGRDARNEVSIAFSKEVATYADLYNVTEEEYMRYSYQNWNPSFAVKMKNYVKDADLHLYCWAVDSTLCDGLALDEKMIKKYTVPACTFMRDECVSETLASVLSKVVSEYSAMDSVIWFESEELGLVWLVKPESAKFDGSIHISKANMLQVRYFVAEAVSSLGNARESLSEYALAESMDVVESMAMLSA